MNALVLLMYWFKARFGFLSMNDFHNLTAWLNRSCSDMTVSVLGVFFAYNTPDEKVLTYIYSYDDSMKRLYLDSLLRGKRGISEREKFYLVNFMPFTSDDVFPCPLDEENLKMLCHLNRTVALCAYAEPVLTVNDERGWE